MTINRREFLGQVACAFAVAGLSSAIPKHAIAEKPKTRLGKFYLDGKEGEVWWYDDRTFIVSWKNLVEPGDYHALVGHIQADGSLTMSALTSVHTDLSRQLHWSKINDPNSWDVGRP